MLPLIRDAKCPSLGKQLITTPSFEANVNWETVCVFKGYPDLSLFHWPHFSVKRLTEDQFPAETMTVWAVPEKFQTLAFFEVQYDGKTIGHILFFRVESKFKYPVNENNNLAAHFLYGTLRPAGMFVPMDQRLRYSNFSWLEYLPYTY